MPFTIVRQDIIRMQVDAVVHSANNMLRMGGGASGALLRAAGTGLQAACDRIAPVATGTAAITPGFGLPARYVIHTVAPVYPDHPHQEACTLLAGCYTNCLKLAEENGCESIAFPFLATGLYAFPKEDALHIATEAIREWLEHSDMNVFLVVYDKESFSVSKQLDEQVRSYINDKYVAEHSSGWRSARSSTSRGSIYADACRPTSASPRSRKTEYEDFSVKQAIRHESILSLEDMLKQKESPFSETLKLLMRQKGYTGPDVYKKANIDKKLFSKIINNPGYHPSKATTLALAIALCLSLDETLDLIGTAGYTLTHASEGDLIVEFFIQRKIYDIFQVNTVLFEHDQPLLGSCAC